MYILVDDEMDLVDKSDMIASARAKGLTLYAEHVAFNGEEPVVCNVGKVAQPLRWEHLTSIRVPDGSPPEVDDALWFIGSCGERDFLVGNRHPFVGRMAAWCPTEQVGYSVSVHEVETMSAESSFFIKGFLVGSEPPVPYDDEGDVDERDLVAWRSALARFRQTGAWHGRWRTCDVCGCVLLPDGSWARTCDECAEGEDTD